MGNSVEQEIRCPHLGEDNNISCMQVSKMNTSLSSTVHLYKATYLEDRRLSF